jgi:hypothetical protein
MVLEALSGEAFPKKCINTKGEGSLARAGTAEERVAILILAPITTPTMSTTTTTITMAWAWAWAVATVARVAAATMAILDMIGVALVMGTLPRHHLANHLADLRSGGHLLVVHTADPPLTHQSHLSEVLIEDLVIPQDAMGVVWVDTAIEATDLRIEQRTVSSTSETGGPANSLTPTALAVIGGVGARGLAMYQGLGIAIKLTALGATIITTMGFFPSVEAFLKYSRKS